MMRLRLFFEYNVIKQCASSSCNSVADPDPPDPYNFPGSGSVSKVGLDPQKPIKQKIL